MNLRRTLLLQSRMKSNKFSNYVKVLLTPDSWQARSLPVLTAHCASLFDSNLNGFALESIVYRGAFDWPEGWQQFVKCCLLGYVWNVYAVWRVGLDRVDSLLELNASVGRCCGYVRFILLVQKVIEKVWLVFLTLSFFYLFLVLSLVECAEQN